jgi:hypothetical protein
MYVCRAIDEECHFGVKGGFSMLALGLVLGLFLSGAAVVAFWLRIEDAP